MSDNKFKNIRLDNKTEGVNVIFGDTRVTITRDGNIDLGKITENTIEFKNGEDTIIIKAANQNTQPDEHNAVPNGPTKDEKTTAPSYQGEVPTLDVIVADWDNEVQPDEASTELIAQDDEARHILVSQTNNLDEGYILETYYDGKGFYIGQWSPVEVTGRPLGKTFNVFAAGDDLKDNNGRPIIATAKKQPSYANFTQDGHPAFDIKSEIDLTNKIRNDSYNGQWVMPPIEIVTELFPDFLGKTITPLGHTRRRHGSQGDTYQSCTRINALKPHLLKAANIDTGETKPHGSSMFELSVKAHTRLVRFEQTQASLEDTSRFMTVSNIQKLKPSLGQQESVYFADWSPLGKDHRPIGKTYRIFLFNIELARLDHTGSKTNKWSRDAINHLKHSARGQLDVANEQELVELLKSDIYQGEWVLPPYDVAKAFATAGLLTDTPITCTASTCAPYNFVMHKAHNNTIDDAHRSLASAYPVRFELKT